MCFHAHSSPSKASKSYTQPEETIWRYYNTINFSVFYIQSDAVIVEQRKRRAKSIIDSLDTCMLEEDEKKFWEILIHRKLKPVSAQLTSINDIQKSLLNLRNSTLFVFFFINISWLILLGYFSFDQLKKHNIDPRAIQIFFLAVYGFLLLIQTVAMLAHRAVTLIHYLGRL